MSVSPPTYSELEVVKNEYADRDYDVKISIPEFTCVCPRTGQPDYATIEIIYVPDQLIVELKSLKLYIQQFRNLGIFHESVTNKILDDFRKACKPRKIDVIGRFNPRGGISTIVEAGWEE
ncbi:MAG: NADPH-dependent 7-cyano-7-deazaguanine reductase QueF [Candidatus Marinimicrobia bacterium]|nr:NADPH-dependent 7-cyano-7-deazaguanine reductase QueF [Candidatus Neomarinimicrobiota bacterium]